MAETWKERWRREVNEAHAAVDALLSSDPTGPALRTACEEAAKARWFNNLAYRWAPWLWRKLKADPSQRVALRPFLLAHLSEAAIDPKGDHHAAWSLAEKALAPWLAELDAADDVEVYRQIVQWKLWLSWRDEGKTYRAMLVARLEAARTPVELRSALARFDFPGQLDEPTALLVYERVGPSAGPFILARLPWKKQFWEALHTRALRSRDDETAWTLYRRQVDDARWAKDVRTLLTTVPDGETLIAELEKRHPVHLEDAGPVFLELAQQRGHVVLPYLQRHVNALRPRWSWRGRTEGKSLPALLELADAQAWTSLWAKILQTAATQDLWNAQLERLLKLDVTTLTVQRKLQLLAGAGNEWNFSGFGVAQVQPLQDDVACLMFERAPALLRGPFRMHLSQNQQHRLPKLLRRVLAADDEAIVDYLAARAAMDQWGHAETLEQLTAHYEALSTTDGTFVRRATNALTMMPAFAIWQYERLLKENRLARLLFERSTPLYLADARLVRELLESPQIHVQALGFRVLATRDPRAGPMAAQMVDVLAPTLLRPLHRRTRLMAFQAIEQACLADETAARVLVGKMKLTFALPDRKYPKEELVGLLGRVLGKWPALRGTGEAPQVFRRSA